MLSLSQCRTILGADQSGSDRELEHLRSQMSALARVAVEAASAGGRAKEPRAVPSWTAAQTHLTNDERIEVEERAAILEADAGYDRDIAERQAVAQFVSGRKKADRGGT